MSLPSRSRRARRQRSRNPAGEQSAGERNGLGDEDGSVEQGGKGATQCRRWIGQVKARRVLCYTGKGIKPWKRIHS